MVLVEKSTRSTPLSQCPSSCEASLINHNGDGTRIVSIGKKQKQLKQHQFCTCIALFGTFRYCTTCVRRPIASFVNKSFRIYIISTWVFLSTLEMSFLNHVANLQFKQNQTPENISWCAKFFRTNAVFNTIQM